MSDRHAWEQPGAHEAAPGVFRIPLPLPGDHLKAVNVYAIVDGEQVVLIDGGWALEDSAELLAASLDKIGFALGGVREFLVTHVHRDHYTQAVAIRRQFGTPVSLGEGERLALQAIHTIDAHPDVANLYQAGAFELSKALAAWQGERDLTNWEDPDTWLTDGLEIPLQTRTLRVIATPGHTRGHVVFHDAGSNLLFAGDHVLPHITPSIGIELSRPESPLRDYLSSLRLVKAMPDATLLPAHGPVSPSAHARADELLDHHEKRLTAMAGSVERGASTAFEVADSITWTRREHRLDDLDLFNQVMAVNETMAHLVVLAERGWLTRTSVDGVEHFARA
ncbi:MBL fold metallo-hydrolase [Jatrophihabitans cynanchi]|uniref:MBL fold metallo-hydrolase n=1 Tax=Jatrophihabitans cynanchi TaxID=2944128 RepID=A0ABY7K5C7_9ACTN|nr:MBL fold metallo-hydrolase [Jatrophihabitans sp. SB3-54]WAX58822.1 MBL fold metallo-hydrolase [Jatrophihabitans sp. SB3-54]